jgi:hypothetical protein
MHYIHMYVHMYINVYPANNIKANIHTYIHTRARTHTHTHTQKIAAKQATVWLTSTLKRERNGGYIRAQHPAEHSATIVARCPDDHVLGTHVFSAISVFESA